MSWSDIKQRFPGKHNLICLHIAISLNYPNKKKNVANDKQKRLCLTWKLYPNSLQLPLSAALVAPCLPGISVPHAVSTPHSTLRVLWPPASCFPVGHCWPWLWTPYWHLYLRDKGVDPRAVKWIWCWWLSVGRCGQVVSFFPWIAKYLSFASHIDVYLMRVNQRNLSLERRKNYYFRQSERVF